MEVGKLRAIIRREVHDPKGGQSSSPSFAVRSKQVRWLPSSSICIRRESNLIPKFALRIQYLCLTLTFRYTLYLPLSLFLSSFSSSSLLPCYAAFLLYSAWELIVATQVKPTVLLWWSWWCSWFVANHWSKTFALSLARFFLFSFSFFPFFCWKTSRWNVLPYL